MKRIGLVLLAGVALVSAVVLADTFGTLAQFNAGVFVGPKANYLAAHKVTKMLAGSATIDFASVTITCEDSTGITITGASTGDPCFVGAPTTISGAGTGLHSSFTCYVSAANTVKVRHCAAGTADNPASATFNVRVLSAQ